MKKFWMVYVEGQSRDTPTKQHETEQAARDEAIRLARKVGRPAIVLKTITLCRVSEAPVIWEPMEA